jgi:phosphoglycerate dehydrogenase-like enzyme
MDVVATRRSVTKPEVQEGVHVYPADCLLDVLAVGDVVVICLPLTDDTEGLIGEPALRTMKRSSYLVAVGRGQVIDESALEEALRERWIAGAGLDVYARKPLPPDSPLFDLPNVIMTPHMSGITRNFQPRLEKLFCENLRRYLADEPLLNVVDKRKGY